MHERNIERKKKLRERNFIRKIELHKNSLISHQEGDSSNSLSLFHNLSYIIFTFFAYANEIPKVPLNRARYE